MGLCSDACLAIGGGPEPRLGLFKHRTKGNEKPNARPMSEKVNTRLKQRPGPGLLEGRVVHIDADFNEPLDDLKDYTE
jgi:hypothetical protein